MNVRESVFVSLKRFENENRYANMEADAMLRRSAFPEADRAFYTAVFYGTVVRRITLDYLIDRLSSRGADIDENIRLILRMSLYQMRYLDRVPDYAVLDCAAELTKRFAAVRAVPFVNAVLRSYQRTGADIPFPDEKKDGPYALSVRESVPLWLCRLWTESYGFEKAKSVAAALSRVPPLTLHVNPLKTDTEAFLAALDAAGLPYEKCRYVKDFVRLKKTVPTETVPGFADGHCFVQDEASGMAAAVLDARPGETVLDACAAPGGKSFAAAFAMGGRGKIVSCDLHENRVRLICEGAARLGISCIDAGTADASVPDPERRERFDRVLCDVPCSGLGVIAKKPDIRNKTEEEIGRLPEIQKKILTACADSVRRGGVLVYSTCTLNPRENEEVVRAFLTERDDFSAVPVVLNGPGASVSRPDGMLTVFPDDFPGADGFFCAKMTRR